MLSHRGVHADDVARICSFPQSAEELYFLFPKATYPLTPEQLRRAIEQRFDSTVVLLDDQVCGFANFYIRVVSETFDVSARGGGQGHEMTMTSPARRPASPPRTAARIRRGGVPPASDRCRQTS